MQLFAKLLDVLTINVIHHPTNVKSLFLIVMMVILALLTASTHLPAVFTLLNALLQICAQPQLALQDNAAMQQRTVMTVMFVLSILATFALELVYIHQSPALAELEILEHAILLQQNVKSEKLAPTTATVLEMETLFINHTVTLLLDVTSHLSLQTKFKT